MYESQPLPTMGICRRRFFVVCLCAFFVFALDGHQVHTGNKNKITRTLLMSRRGAGTHEGGTALFCAFFFPSHA